MNELPLTKQFEYAKYCQIVDQVNDPNTLRQMLKEAYHSYLAYQHGATSLLSDKLIGDIKKDYEQH